MPVHGARTTDGVSRTAAIPRSSNAGPRFAASRDLARRIHSPGRRTGRAPEAGVPPTRRGVIGATTREEAPTRGAVMRTIVLVSLALAGISLTTTVADAGAWCASYRWGGTNCGYSSSDQCWATVRGIGGCRPNPFPGTAYGTSAGSWNAPAAPRRYQRAY